MYCRRCKKVKQIMRSLKLVRTATISGAIPDLDKYLKPSDLALSLLSHSPDAFTSTAEFSA